MPYQRVFHSRSTGIIAYSFSSQYGLATPQIDGLMLGGTKKTFPKDIYFSHTTVGRFSLFGQPH